MASTTESVKYIFSSDVSGLQDASKSMGSVNLNAKNVAQTMGKIVSSLLVARGVKNIMSNAIGRVDTLDSAQKSLGLMLGDMSKGKKVANDLSEAIQGTPLALDAVIGDAKQLVGAGLEADKVKGSFQAIADVSFGNQDQIDSITNALSKMETQGHISGEVIQSLSDNGVPAMRILANEAGVSVDEMTKRVSSGSVDAKTAMKELTDGIENGTKGMAGATAKYAGLAKQAGQTISGSWANVKTAVTRNTANLIAPLQGPTVALFNTASQGLDTLGKSLTTTLAPAVKTISTNMANFNTTLTNVVKNISDGKSLGGIGAIFGGGFDAKGLIGTLAPAIAEVGDTIIGMIPGFTGNLLSSIIGPMANIGGLAGNAVIETLAGVVSGLDWGTIFNQMTTTVLPAITSFIGLFSQISGVFFGIGQALAPLVQIFITGLMPIFSQLDALFQNLQIALAPLIANVISIVQVIATALQPILIIIMTVIQQVTGIIMGIVQSIIVQLVPVIDQLIQALEPVIITIGQIVAKIATALMPVIAVIVNILGGVLKMAIQFIINVIKIAIGIITQVANVLNAVLQPALKIVTSTINIFKKGIDNLVGGFKNLMDWVGKVGDRIGGFVKQVQDAGDKVGGFLSKLNPFKSVGGSFDLVTGNIPPGSNVTTGMPQQYGQTNVFNIQTQNALTPRQAYRQTQELRQGGRLV